MKTEAKNPRINFCSRFGDFAVTHFLDKKGNIIETRPYIPEITVVKPQGLPSTPDNVPDQFIDENTQDINPGFESFDDSFENFLSFDV